MSWFSDFSDLISDSFLADFLWANEYNSGFDDAIEQVESAAGGASVHDIVDFWNGDY